MKRCSWATNELNIAYHDTEWGVPVHDDIKFFEFLVLEGAQAGLSWDTVLRKRDAYRLAFAGFDPVKVASFSGAKMEKLMMNEGIIRNRSKIASAVSNAKAFLDLQKEFGSFDKYIWSFVGGKQIVNKRTGGDVPAKTDVSDAISKDLKKRGFSFVGSTIMYAFMQATGMVNDHLTSCFRYGQV
jgi:DNA-3-methyladenine glycosylase I